LDLELGSAVTEARGQFGNADERELPPLEADIRGLVKETNRRREE
jgi:hypothetical protein